ncbi:MAG: TrmH family RNA methyltransferase [Cyclobacteriaceae bacterium]|nr:RNA methyltransferase [Flammeovirgaceae bacterium]
MKTQTEIDQLVIQHLLSFVSEKRIQTMERVLSNRTRYVTLVLEDIYQSQNASAAVRTCECLGVQDIHIIEKASSYAVNRKVLKGSNKWMNIIKHREKNQDNTALCYQHLRSAGYKILVTDPDPDGVPIHEIDLSQKMALVMGNEYEGISDYALKHADQKVHIPMYGFTESFNISVSAAICLQTILHQLRQAAINWQLTEHEIQELRLNWLRKSVRRSDLIEQEFLRTIQ